MHRTLLRNGVLLFPETLQNFNSVLTQNKIRNDRLYIYTKHTGFNIVVLSFLSQAAGCWNKSVIFEHFASTSKAFSFLCRSFPAVLIVGLTLSLQGSFDSTNSKVSDIFQLQSFLARVLCWICVEGIQVASHWPGCTICTAFNWLSSGRLSRFWSFSL